MSLSITIGTKELSLFQGHLRDLSPKLLKAVEEAAAFLASKITAEARTRAPVRTGFLRGHILAAGKVVESQAPYSLFVEYGTRFVAPRPFMRPTLAFVWPTAGEVVKARVEEALRGA